MSSLEIGLCLSSTIINDPAWCLLEMQMPVLGVHHAQATALQNLSCWIYLPGVPDAGHSSDASEILCLPPRCRMPISSSAYDSSAQVALLVSEKQAENRAREEKLKADEERVKAQRMRSMKSKVSVTCVICMMCMTCVTMCFSWKPVAHRPW
jgi:hypothetical protein